MELQTESMGDQFKLIQKKEYPDPRSLPRPETYDPKPQVALADVTPNIYENVACRIISYKTSERRDELGTKVIFTGLIEDASCRIPFVCHKLNVPFSRDTVFKFNNAYIHEFPDKSILLVVTEHTDWQMLDVDGYYEFQQYVYKPKIDKIKRPIQNISLDGTITTVHNNSGLVKRCNNCRSLLYDDECLNKCQSEWGWDLRISSKLYDGSGSIKMVLTRDVASRILQRNLSELILLSTQPNLTPDNNKIPSSSVYQIKLPEAIPIIEAVTENPSS